MHGYDIYLDWEESKTDVIKPHETILMPTGIACVVPQGYYFQVEERGSTGSKGIKKSAGVIDSSYRGEIFIAITNSNDKPIWFLNENDASSPDAVCYKKTKAIAQLVLHKVPELPVEEISYEKLLQIPSKRGVGALGSTNK